MRDVVFLLADNEMKSCFEGFFSREHYHQSLRCRRFDYELFQDPLSKDSELFYNAHTLLANHFHSHSRAIIVLDWQWNESDKTRVEIEQYIEKNMLSAGWLHERFEVICIEPEVDIWLFQDNDNFLNQFRYFNGPRALRKRLATDGKWAAGHPKPAEPKEAIEHALFLGQSRSRSVLYKRVCSKVSVRSCQDAAFNKLMTTLQRWFPQEGM